MTQIFFYHNAADRIAALAALIVKAYAQRKALLIYAPDVQDAEALDRRLWTHPPGSFVPHVRGNSPLAGETPVVITDEIDAQTHSERLINLSPEVPNAFSRFASVIEVVGHDERERQAGRERVRFYKDRGYAVKFIDLAEYH